MSLDLFMLFVIHACTNKTRGSTDDSFLDVLDVVGDQQTVTFGSWGRQQPRCHHIDDPDLGTCWVFTLCVVRNQSASVSTVQSWAFLPLECTVQSEVLTWSSRGSRVNFLQTQTESCISVKDGSVCVYYWHLNPWILYQCVQFLGFYISVFNSSKWKVLKRGVGQCVTKLSSHNFACMWYVIMIQDHRYLESSILNVLRRFRLNSQHPNSQPPLTSNSEQNCVSSPTTISQ